MSPSSPASLLADLVFLGLFAGGLREPWLWSAAAVPLWALAAAFPPRCGALAPFWAAWLAWVLASALACPEPLIGLAAFSRTATPALIFVLACGRFSASERRRIFPRLWAAAALLGLAAAFLYRPRYPWSGLLYPHYGYTGCLLACAFAGALAAALHPGSRRWGWRGRAGLWVMMAFSLSLIAAMRSRGALWACAFSAAVALWRRGSKRALLAALLGFAAAAALVPSSALVRFLKLDAPSAPVRLSIWRAACAVAGDHPFFGEGPGRFERGFLRHNFPAPPAYPTRFGLTTAYAHSEVLQAASETGFAGLALFLLALGAALFRRGFAAPRGDWSLEAARASFAAVFAQSLVDNVFALPGLALLCFLLLGACSQEEALGQEVPAPSRSAWTACCAAGCLLAALAWWPQWAVGRYSAKALEAPAQGEAWMLQALRIAPRDPSLWEDLCRVRLKSGRPQDALEAMSEAVRLSPTNALYRLVKGDILLGAGRWRAAAEEGAAAAALEPASPQARLILAQAFLGLGRPERARAALQEARSLRGAAGAPSPGAGYDGLVLGLDEGRLESLDRALDAVPAPKG